MSDNNEQPMDFLNTLTSAQLDNLLVMELAAEGADTEKIKRINRALRAKSGGQTDIDVQAKWLEFQSNYSETEPLYDLENEASDITHSQPKAGKKRAPLGAAIAAIAVIVLLSGTLTAYAFGFDVFGAIATWTKENFGFTEPDASPKPSIPMGEKPVPQPLEELASLMSENGVSCSQLPSYIPEGYELSEAKCDELLTEKKIFCFLNNGENNIIFEYTVCEDNVHGTEYEKDADDPEEYSKNGVTHYIMTNFGDYFAVWLSGNMECSIYIAGGSTKDELIKIIDSIYEW